MLTTKLAAITRAMKRDGIPPLLNKEPSLDNVISLLEGLFARSNSCIDVIIFALFIMNFPTLSVVIPVFNVERYIGKCLDSVGSIGTF